MNGQMKGRDRNRQCPCLSGKKWKKCHPDLDIYFTPPILRPDDPPEKLEEYIKSYVAHKRTDRFLDRIDTKTLERKGVIQMLDTQEARLKELEAKKTDGSILPLEEAVRVALLELDERSEILEEAKTANPVPDPVKVAQDAVDVAQKAVDDAEAALAQPVV